MSERTRTLVTFAAIALFAFAVRLVYLLEARDCPMFGGLVVDGASYGEWSDRIAAGDFLGREIFYQAPLYPYFLGAVKVLLGSDLWTIRIVQIVLGANRVRRAVLAGRRFVGDKCGNRRRA
jgi:predicted membrane-bound mannosyltransferase